MFVPQKTILATRKIAGYGWKRDYPDHRDHKLQLQKQALLAASSDLKSGFPDAFDQIDLGSCTANAGAGLGQFLMRKRWRNPASAFAISRLFLYYLERTIEKTVNEDSGASLRDVMKVMNSVGCPHESFWPYDTKRFTVKPSGDVYYDAKFHRIGQYLSVPQTHDGIVQVLTSGYPVVFGFTVFEALESDIVALTGAVPMPSTRDKPIGGHAVVLTGHDDATARFKFRNSWSPAWAKDGYGTLPYDYVLNPDLADDFWTASMIS